MAVTILLRFCHWKHLFLSLYGIAFQTDSPCFLIAVLFVLSASDSVLNCSKLYVVGMCSQKMEE